MRAVRQLRLLILMVGTLAVTAIECGGKTSTDLPGGPGMGGSVGVGGDTSTGSVAAGGTSAATGRRVPVIHRSHASSCVGVHSPAEPDIAYPGNSECTRHADCTAGVNGKCVVGLGMMSMTGFCVYDECATDADCEPGKVCFCSPTDAARCLLVGNCQVDAACADTGNSYCSPSMGMDCGGNHRVDSYYCHTGADTCLDNSDCKGTDYCNFSIYSGRWECTAINNGCIIG